MVLSTMRRKEVTKGSELPAKGRIDVFMGGGMQISSSSLTQRGSNGRCHEPPVTGRPLMSVRSVTAVSPKAPKKGTKPTPYLRLHGQILTVIDKSSTQGRAAP